MGNGGSKPGDEASRHVFSAETPVRFSQQVIEQLQSSPDTDSTRARHLELQVQQRVHAELLKIRDQEAQSLTELTERLTSDAPQPSSSGEGEEGASHGDEGEESLASRLKSAVTPGSAKSDDSATQRTTDSVKKEIEALRAKLEARRKLEQPAASVTKAKDELVRCLRVNDRRPLDCWLEVENFKGAVAEVERGFVAGAMR